MNDMHLALHGVAIKKHAPAGAVAEAVGLAPARADALLAEAAAGGRLVEAQGAYALTPAGRMILDSQYSRYYDELREDAAFVAAYERFERVNVELKQVITDWQTMDVGGQKVRNDHSNKDYDAEVLDRLGEVHERFEPILAQLIRGLPRLTVYRHKLERALEEAEAGKLQWVSDAKLESYHTVWFEMHEDLLRVLGRQREE
jgi:hypothetical protein